MKKVHKNLKSANFTKPNGIVSAKVCAVTGKVATDKCTDTYTEIFASGTVPSECDGHQVVKICKESKLLATEYCPETETKVYPPVPEKERNASWKPSGGNSKESKITETCDIHTEETQTVTITNLIGKTETEAKDALTGLTVKVVFSEDKSKANGVVLKQSLSAGTKAKKGSTITLTINELKSSPSETEKPENNITNTTKPDTGENTTTE